MAQCCRGADSAKWVYSEQSSEQIKGLLTGVWKEVGPGECLTPLRKLADDRHDLRAELEKTGVLLGL